MEAWLASLGRLPTQDELDAIVAPLLDALQMMHAANFLHRDIAPDNIIVRTDGTPVLLDFGAARRAVAEMSRTLTGIVKAGSSPHGAVPSDSRLQGPWSDLYALGGTLYRAVTGHPPEEATLRVDEDHMPPGRPKPPARWLPAGLPRRHRCLPQGPALGAAPVRGPAAADDARAQFPAEGGLNRFVEMFRTPSKWRHRGHQPAPRAGPGSRFRTRPAACGAAGGNIRRTAVASHCRARY